MSSEKHRVIINADDLGISQSVNTQIEECIKNGIISSSTLIVNAPSFEDGVAIAKKYPQISIGIHLNLVEFSPLTNHTIFKAQGLIDEGGCFIDGAIFSVPINSELKQAILEEWDAQICKFKDAGLTPSHIDSHQHTHTIFSLQDILCQLMEKHQIKKVRRKIIPSIGLMLYIRKHSLGVVHYKSDSVLRPHRSILSRCIHLFYVIIQSWLWNRKMSKDHIMTDCFIPYRSFIALKEMGRTLRCKTIELMCHPGHVDYQTETDSMMIMSQSIRMENELVSYFSL